MTKTFKTILLLIVIIFSFQLFIPTTLAADKPESLEFTPQVPIPGSEFGDGKMIVGTSGQSTNTAGKIVTTMRSTLLPRYIKAIYNYGIGIAAFLALAMIVAGGLIWLTSGGSTDKISTARSMIVSAIIGLILLLGTYTLLQIVSPALLNFKAIETEYIGALQIVCCEADGKAKNMTNKKCDEQKGESIKNASPNTDGTKCLQNGCCVFDVSEYVVDWKLWGTYNNLTTCVDTNSEVCTGTDYGNWNSGGLLGDAKRTFDPNSCSQVEKCDYADPCKGRTDGSACSRIYDDCWCFDEKPNFGKAKHQEPCGDDNFGKCLNATDYGVTANGDCDEDEGFKKDNIAIIKRSRPCEDGLICCYYDPE